MKKHIHIIGVGGIGIAAIARYYLALGWSVSGTDGTPSDLTMQLAEEGVMFQGGEHPEAITPDTQLVVYTEAILRNKSEAVHRELARAHELGIRTIPYPVALAEIANPKRLIAVAGSHGKSTTTSMLGVVLRACQDGSVVVGTQVPQLDHKNCFFDVHSANFAIEACEYRRSFLQYTPAVTIITNIDVDHLDYFKDEADYIAAFQTLVDQTTQAVIMTGDDALSQKIYTGNKVKICVFSDAIEIGGVRIPLPQLTLQVPGKHILHDAHLAFAAARFIGLPEEQVIAALESYAGSWRRSEIVRTTRNGNILISDYGHHPSEIRATLGALREKYAGKKMIVAFQPHQYSRTRELLADFATAFASADTLIIPDIYFSRDSDEDIAAMPVEKLLSTIRQHHADVRGGKGMEDTLRILQEIDAQETDVCLILLGAGNIDDLRKKIL